MAEDWSWLGPILEAWGPMGVVAVLLAGGAFFAAVAFAGAAWKWRRRLLGVLGTRHGDDANGNDGNGGNGALVERRRGVRELVTQMTRLEKDQARLWGALRKHEEKNEQRTVTLHAKIEALRDDVEMGFRESRKADARAIESVRSDLRTILGRLSGGTPPGKNSA